MRGCGNGMPFGISSMRHSFREILHYVLSVLLSERIEAFMNHSVQKYVAVGGGSVVGSRRTYDIHSRRIHKR